MDELIRLAEAELAAALRAVRRGRLDIARIQAIADGKLP